MWSCGKGETKRRDINHGMQGGIGSERHIPGAKMKTGESSLNG